MGLVDELAELKKNKEQWEAYQSTGNCVVLAGPGSGKTKTLVLKTERLLRELGRDVGGVACLTYNTECVKEIRERLFRIGLRTSHRLFVGTVHSFCFQRVVLPFAHLVSKGSGFRVRVARKREQDILFEKAVKSVRGEEVNSSAFQPSCTDLRRNVLRRNKDNWDPDSSELALMVDRYEALLREAGLIDFEGMILTAVKLITRYGWIRDALVARFPFLVIDEYQDLGLPLHTIVENLVFENKARLFAVGDPDQSIYRFIGARPKLLTDLAANKAVHNVHLNLNFRSGTTIVHVARHAFETPRTQKAHNAETGNVYFWSWPGGLSDQIRSAVDKIIPEALASGVAKCLGDIAIIYPNQYTGNDVAAYLDVQHVPYVRTDKGGPYARTHVTNWIEACATWCSGGWRSANPRVSDLAREFHTIICPGARTVADDAAKESLLRFLIERRRADLPAGHWVRELWQSVLKPSMAQNRDLVADVEEDVEAMHKAFDEGGKLSGYNLRKLGGLRGSPDHLLLTTAYGAKGLEFGVVVMLDLEEGKLPHSRSKGDPEALAEERRKFYVALTRAKNEVNLMYSGWIMTRDRRRWNVGVSRFVEELKVRVGVK
jgi:DNA helicase II / ATP-dependent DNA helicase PcrA